MAALFFTCPKTKHPVPTGVEMTVEGLRQSWLRTLRLTCPHCGEEHDVAVRQTYLNAALDDALERLALQPAAD
jgi:hypothetical protein